MITRGQAEAVTALVVVGMVVLAGVVGFVAPAGGAAATLSATRTIDKPAVEPGATTTVTLAIQVESNRSRISVTETFEPAFQAVGEPAVAYEGGNGTTVANRSAADAVTVVAANVTAGTTMVVTYNVTGGNTTGMTHTIVGNVTAGNLSIPPNGASQLPVAERAPPNVTVRINSTTSPVDLSDRLNVTARLTNTGDKAATQPVTLSTNGIQRDTTTVTLEGGASTNVTLSWAPSQDDAGPYTATLASANDSDSTAVAVVGDATPTDWVTFSNKTVQDEQGDVATIPITFNDIDRATLVLGAETVGYLATVGYLVRLRVIDGNGDGTATVRWNTHLARQTDDASVAFTAAGASDRVTAVERLHGDDDATLGRRIATAEYPMTLSVGGVETDAGTVSVVAPGTVERSLSVRRAPESLAAGAVPGNVTADATSPGTTMIITEGDWMVLTIRTAGIHGYIDGTDDLSRGEQGVSLSIEETGSGTDTVALDRFTYVDRADSNELMLIADTGMRDFKLNAEYQATYTIDAEANPYVDDTVRSSIRFLVMYPGLAGVVFVALIVALLVAIPVGRVRMGE